MNNNRLAVYLIFVASWVTVRSIDALPTQVSVDLMADGALLWSVNGKALPPSAHRGGQPPLSALGLPIPLNLADEKLLTEVHGIGEKRAAAIVKNRSLEGCFYKMSDLDRVRGFGLKTVVSVAPYLNVGPIDARVCGSQRSG